MKYPISQLAYKVLDYLEVNAQGKDNAVYGKTIAHHFNLSTLTIRKAIKEIREETDIVIGADTNIGYYLPLDDELEKANQYRRKKALSELKGNAINDKGFILKAYRVLNEAVKTLDEKAQARLFEDIRKIGE
jgi:biotin operon repressor